MRRVMLLVVAFVCASASSLAAHDMYLKLDSFFVFAGDTMTIPLLNGTFTKSENAVTRDRVRDLSLVSPRGTTQPLPVAWRDKGDTTVFRLTTKDEGTYVVGLSTLPRELNMTGKAFTSYLTEEGITNILQRRKDRGETGKPARERYSKHVKALVQVGDARTDNYQTVLGYPAEIIPLDNPYAGSRSGMLRLRCLVDGKPVPNLTVIVGTQHERDKPVEHSIRTDRDGIVTVSINHPGRWFARFVRMVPASGGGIDYESKWATLTFQVGKAR